MEKSHFASEEEKNSALSEISNQIKRLEKTIDELNKLIDQITPASVRQTIEADIKVSNKGEGASGWPATFLRRHAFPWACGLLLFLWATWAVVLIIPLYFVNAFFWNNKEETYRKAIVPDEILTELSGSEYISESVKQRFAHSISSTGHLTFRDVYSERESLQHCKNQLKTELARTSTLSVLGKGARDLLMFK